MQIQARPLNLAEGRLASPADVVHCLKRGGVVLLPTDTVYGLAADAASLQAVDRVFELKKRPRNKNLPIMVASPDDLGPLGLAVSGPVKRLLASPLVPGALTFAMGFDGSPVPSWLTGREEVAVRIPDDEFLLDVLRSNGPLCVTSANMHGHETAQSLADALRQLNGAPDMAIDGGILSDVPSTLVNCRTDPPTIERIGAIPAEIVMEYLS